MYSECVKSVKYDNRCPSDPIIWQSVLMLLFLLQPGTSGAPRTPRSSLKACTPSPWCSVSPASRTSCRPTRASARCRSLWAARSKTSSSSWSSSSWCLWLSWSACSTCTRTTLEPSTILPSPRELWSVAGWRGWHECVIRWCLWRGQINSCYNSNTKLEEPHSPGHVAWLMRLFLGLLNSWRFINRGDQLKACLRTEGWERIQLPSTKSVHTELNHRDFTLTWVSSGKSIIYLLGVWSEPIFFVCVCTSGSIKWTGGALGDVLAAAYPGRNSKLLQLVSERNRKSSLKGVNPLNACSHADVRSTLNLNTLCRNCHDPVFSLLHPLTSLLFLWFV